MTDKEWSSAIRKAADLATKHRDAIKLAEDEYQRRYGFYPSSICDDGWINVVHYYGGCIDLKVIKRDAEEAVKRAKEE